jgi:cytidylate kinase
MLRLKYVIAIDGPAGAGKSSTAYRLAKSLNYLFIDSGAIYRAITYKWLKEDRCQINKLLNLLSLDLKLPWYNPQKIKLYIDKENILRHLRDEEVEVNVSYIARQPEIRRFVTDYLQRKIKNILKYKGIVIEGRDIGTVVYKEADIKFYLDASLSERTKRRLKQNKTKLINYDKVYQDIKLRDLADMTRPLGKLKKADDAWYINTTHLKLKEVVKILKDKVNVLKKIDNHTFIYNILHLIAWILFRIFFFIEVKGIENFPASGGILLICNHLSYLDPPIIGACAIRRLNYIARNSYLLKIDYLLS